MKPMSLSSRPVRARHLASAAFALACVGAAAQTPPAPAQPPATADPDRVIVSPDPPRHPGKHRRTQLVRPTHPTAPPSRPQRPVTALR